MLNIYPNAIYNKKGVHILNRIKNLTVFDRLNRKIRDHNLLYREGDMMGRVGMIEIRGSISFAYEMGLITKEEWETLISKVFLIMDGE